MVCDAPRPDKGERRSTCVETEFQRRPARCRKPDLAKLENYTVASGKTALDRQNSLKSLFSLIYFR